MMTTPSDPKLARALIAITRSEGFAPFREWVQGTIRDLHRAAYGLTGEPTQRLIGEAAVLQDLLDCIEGAPRRQESAANGPAASGTRPGAGKPPG